MKEEASKLNFEQQVGFLREKKNSRTVIPGKGKQYKLKKTNGKASWNLERIIWMTQVGEGKKQKTEKTGGHSDMLRALSTLGVIRGLGAE